MRKLDFEVLSRFSRFMLLAMAFCPCAAALSQPAASDSKAKSAEAQKSGPDSTSETFGDWSVVCAVSPVDPAERVCEVNTNILRQGQTSPAARLALGKEGKDRPMRVVVLVPVNVSIAPGVAITAEPGKPGISLAYRTCAGGACFAQADLTKDQMAALRSAPGRGTPGQVTFSDPAGKTVALDFSFRGFDQALDALQKH